MQDEKKDPEYEVCLCKHVKRAQVEKLIRDMHIRDLKTLCEKGDIGNKCGGCREDLQQILDDVLADM